jgi:hypothetical protein
MNKKVIFNNKLGFTRKKIVLNNFKWVLKNLNQNNNEIKLFRLFTPKFIGNKSFNWHDDFIKTFNFVFKNKNTMDICCGHNPIKKIFKNDKKTSIVGIDLYEDEADLKIDINKIEKYIKPKKQFNLITAFSPMNSSFTAKRFSKYLKDDGLYITEMGKYYFYNDYLPIIKGEKINKYFELEEELKFFKPIFMVETKGLIVFRINPFNKKISFLSGDHFYIFYKKL